MTYGDILYMPAQDREWYLTRLYRQLKEEEKAYKKR
jgi:hypothetical protein